MRVFLLRKDYSKEGVYKLSKKERNYLFNVLRLHVNDVFTAKDTEENFYKAFLFDEETLTLETTDTPEETLLDGLSSYSGPFVPITMFISVLKGKKNEMEVRALTEIGVKKIVIMDTEFTQEKLNSHALERISSIIREAVQQSGGKTPELIGPISFEEAIRIKQGKSILLHQAMLGETSTLSDILNGASVNENISAFIGPEGGFSDKECILAQQAGITPVLLSTNILRAETAAIYTAAAIQALLQN